MKKITEICKSLIWPIHVLHQTSRRGKGTRIRCIGSIYSLFNWKDSNSTKQDVTHGPSFSYLESACLAISRSHLPESVCVISTTADDFPLMYQIWSRHSWSRETWCSHCFYPFWFKIHFLFGCARCLPIHELTTQLCCFVFFLSHVRAMERMCRFLRYLPLLRTFFFLDGSLLECNGRGYHVPTMGKWTKFVYSYRSTCKTRPESKISTRCFWNSGFPVN